MKTTASNRGEPAGEPLRAFILEDNPRDAKLMVAILEREGYAVQYEITDSQELFRERLENGECDIVLADFNLRSWNAFDALDILSQSGKDVPLIVVTGSLGDEGAVDCVKRGAADFVLKDRPARLPWQPGKPWQTKDCVTSGSARKKSYAIMKQNSACCSPPILCRCGSTTLRLCGFWR